MIFNTIYLSHKIISKHLFSTQQPVLQIDTIHYTDNQAPHTYIPIDSLHLMLQQPKQITIIAHIN